MAPKNVAPPKWPPILVLHRSHIFPLHVSNTTRVDPPDLCSIYHTPTYLKLDVTIQQHRENSQPSTSRPSRAREFKQPTPDFPLVSCLVEYVTEEKRMRFDLFLLEYQEFLKYQESVLSSFQRKITEST